MQRHLRHSHSHSPRKGKLGAITATPARQRLSHRMPRHRDIQQIIPGNFPESTSPIFLLLTLSIRNQAYYPDSQYDPTFDHIGSWAQGIPYDMYSRDTQNGRISWEQFQPPAPNAERRKKKNTGAPQTSYQMDRYLSQQPKQDPWSILSREQRNK